MAISITPFVVWDFENNGNDSSGNGNVCSPPVTYPVGFFGNCTGATCNITTNMSNYDIFDGDFSVCWWQKWAASKTGSVQGRLKVVGSTTTQVELIRSSATSRTFRINENSVVTATGTVTSSATWQHVCITASGDQTKIYFDGTLVSTTTRTVPSSLGTITQVQFGGNQTCYHDQFAAFTGALTDSDVSQLYNSGSGLQYAGWYVGGTAHFGTSLLTTAAVVSPVGRSIGRASKVLTASATLSASTGVSGNAVLATSGSLAANGRNISRATTSLATTGTIAANGRRIQRATTSLATSGSLAGSGKRIQRATTSLITSGSLAANAKRTTKGTVGLTAASSLAATANVITTHSANAVLATSGSLAAIGKKTTKGNVVLATTGSFAASGKRISRATTSLATTGSLAANGKRITKGSVGLSATGSLAASGYVSILGSCHLNLNTTLAANGHLNLIGVLNLNANASIAAIGEKSLLAAATLTSQATISPLPKLISGGKAPLDLNGSLNASGTIQQTGQASLGSQSSVNASGIRTTRGAISLNGSGSISAIGKIQSYASSVLVSNATVQALGKKIGWQTIGEAIRNHLLQQSAITDLTTRIYPVRFPQHATYPAICYTIVRDEREHNLRGSSGIATADIQFDILADSYAEKLEIANALHFVLQSYSGDLDQVECLNCSLINHYDDDSQSYYRKIMDFAITYRESIPSLSGERITSTKEIEASLVSYLSDLAPVFPSVVPQYHNGIAIVYKRTGTEQDQNLTDHSNLENCDFEITVIGESYQAVSRLQNKIRERLDGLCGVIADTETYNVSLKYASDLYSKNQSGSDKATYWKNSQYRMIVA